MKDHGGGLQDEAARKAHDCLIEGWNCSQSIVLTMQELLGVGGRESLKAATGFGGGVGNMGGVCGALAGGVMVLGLIYGRSELGEKEQKERTYRVCAEWFRLFNRVMGSVNCIEILKVDLKDPAVRQAYWRDPDNRERCASQSVGRAARLLMELIEESGPPAQGQT